MTSHGELVPGMQDTHPALVSGRGARVVVHSQDSLPHPTAEGYDYKPTDHHCPLVSVSGQPVVRPLTTGVTDLRPVSLTTGHYQWSAAVVIAAYVEGYDVPAEFSVTIGVSARENVVT